MKRKVTLVFHDEDLYTADAVREWLESREDAELIPVIESVRSEWNKGGGRSWTEVERELAESLNRNEENPQAKRV